MYKMKIIIKTVVLASPDFVSEFKRLALMHAVRVTEVSKFNLLSEFLYTYTVIVLRGRVHVNTTPCTQRVTVIIVFKLLSLQDGCHTHVYYRFTTTLIKVSLTTR
jgi:hypothetical protein